MYIRVLLNKNKERKFIDAVPTSGCVCPGDTLSYECTVTGMLSAVTIWSGSALNNCIFNEIVLLHNHFNTGTYNRICSNNGAIVVRGLSVEGNIYTSQLNITVTPDIAEKTIECGSDNGTHYKRLYTWTIPPVTGLSSEYSKPISCLYLIITIGALLPPDKIGISNADSSLRQLTFSWSPVAPDCPAIHYNILASNCGSCPTTTKHTNATCTDVPTDDNECNFAIQTVVCGNITVNFSINTHIFYPRDTNTAYIISISSLATFSIVSITALLIVIVIILMRSRIKIKAAFDSQGTIRAVSSTQMESMYEEPIPSVSAIKTRDNIAYGHTKTTTT